MSPQFVLTIGRDALTILLMIVMPVLGVGRAVGLLTEPAGHGGRDGRGVGQFAGQGGGAPAQNGRVDGGHGGRGRPRRRGALRAWL